MEKNTNYSLTEETNNAITLIFQEIMERTNGLKINVTETIIGDILDLPYDFQINKEMYDQKMNNLKDFKKEIKEITSLKLNPYINILNTLKKPLTEAKGQVNKLLIQAIEKWNNIALNQNVVDLVAGVKNGAKIDIKITNISLKEISEDIIKMLIKIWAKGEILEEIKKGNCAPFLKGISYEINV